MGKTDQRKGIKYNFKNQTVNLEGAKSQKKMELNEMAKPGAINECQNNNKNDGKADNVNRNSDENQNGKF